MVPEHGSENLCQDESSPLLCSQLRGRSAAFSVDLSGPGLRSRGAQRGSSLQPIEGIEISAAIDCLPRRSKMHGSPQGL